MHIFSSYYVRKVCSFMFALYSDDKMPELLKRPDDEGTKADAAVKITIKKEVLTPPRARDDQHDARSRKKPPDRHSIVSPPPLLPCQSYAAKLRASVDNPCVDTPQAKKSKVGERYVGFCTCGQKSQCSISRCDCRKAGIECTTCRSS